MKEKLIYFYPSQSSFIHGDIDELSAIYNVKHQSLLWKSKVRLPLNLILQFFFLCWNFRGSKALIVSFAGYHSFLPVLFGRIFRKNVFIVLNGTDSVGIKELNYGSHLKKILRWFCKFSTKHATELWPVSLSLINGKNEFIGKRLEYGIVVSFPEVKTPYFPIPNGFNFDMWTLESSIQRKNRIISVVSSEGQFELKGIDLMLELSRQLDEFEFVIVGMNTPGSLRSSSNLNFTGKITQSELSNLFTETKYYLQLSSFEGFGCSLCEAMLSGCIPIGSRVNAIPEIIGESGAILEKKELSELESLILDLNSLSPEEQHKLSESARNRITSNYPISGRIEQMISRIDLYDKKNR